MATKLWKVRAVCNECKKAWTTRAKNNSGAPSQCKSCDSTNVRRRSAWEYKSAQEKAAEEQQKEEKEGEASE